MKNQLMLFALISAVVFLAPAGVLAHDIFKDVMKEVYPIKSFSCKACHPDNGDRKIRTMFADLIYEQLKDKNLSAKWAEVEPQGKEAIAIFEQSIVDDFKKAMVVVGQKPLTINDLINNGLFNGARLDKTKVAALKAAAPDATKGSDSDATKGSDSDVTKGSEKVNP